jgi:hypothetical protein
VPVKNFTKPDPVRRCGKPGHGTRHDDCDDCKLYSAYEARRRRWERNHGIDNRMVDADLVADHLHDLVENGNWKLVDVAAVSGVPRVTVGMIYGRRRQLVTPLNAASLLALKPREKPRPPMSILVPALESVRILRGLAAQGWTFRHMSRLLGFSETWAQKIAPAGEWVHEDTAPMIRRLAVQLRAQDLANLPRPLPGMDVRTANYAKRKGWVPLAAWYGQDMADPAAKPWRFKPTGSKMVAPVPLPAVVVDQDDDLPEVSPWSYIDPILTLRVAEAAESVRRTNRDNGRRPDGYVPHLIHLTRIEAYAVVDAATKAGISATLIGVMLGYRIGTKSELSNAHRAVERMKATFKQARDVVSQLAAGDAIDPGWFVQKEAGNGVNDFPRIATAVLAVQGAPFGPGWSPAELAARAGMDEDAIRAFLAYATRRADTPYVVKHITRSRPATCAEQSNLVIPVDLDAVLST